MVTTFMGIFGRFLKQTSNMNIKIFRICQLLKNQLGITCILERFYNTSYICFSFQVNLRRHTWWQPANKIACTQPLMLPKKSQTDIYTQVKHGGLYAQRTFRLQALVQIRNDNGVTDLSHNMDPFWALLIHLLKHTQS